jgi:hypothetical protein
MSAFAFAWSAGLTLSAAANIIANMTPAPFTRPQPA